MRLAQSEDAAALAALHAAASNVAWSSAEYRRLCRPARAPTDYVLVATGDGAVAGFIVVSRVFDEASIHNVVVDEALRRRGVGRVLVEACLAREADVVARWLLEVRASNLPARELYRSLGFVEDGRRPGYYPAGEAREDAILMSLTNRKSSA